MAGFIIVGANVANKAFKEFEEEQQIPALFRGLHYVSAIWDEDIELEASSKYAEGNRVVNILDKIASGRLSIWGDGLERATMLGKNQTGIGEDNSDHMHSSFVDWIVRYGWIIGVVLNVWFITLLIKAMKAAKDPRDSLLLFVTSFFLAYAMTDIQSWRVCSGFLLLFLQTPHLTIQESNELIEN